MYTRRCVLIATLIVAPVSFGQVIDGTASWWDPPASYIGACNVPVNAWGPNFIATSIQNWQRGGSGVCGQPVQITSTSNGVQIKGYVTDLCLENCTDTTDIQLSLSSWKQLYSGSKSPAAQLVIPVKFELVGSPIYPPPSTSQGSSTGVPVTSSSSTSQKNGAATSKTSNPSRSSSQAAASSQTATPMTVPSGAIIGAAVGGVALAIIISLIVLFIVRRKRRERRRSSVELRPSTDRNRSDSSHLPMVANSYSTMDYETRRSTLTHSSSQNRLSSHRKPVPVYDPDLMSEFPVRNSGIVVPESAHPSWREDPYLSTYPRSRSPYRGA